MVGNQVFHFCTFSAFTIDAESTKKNSKPVLFIPLSNEYFHQTFVNQIRI